MNSLPRRNQLSVQWHNHELCVEIPDEYKIVREHVLLVLTKYTYDKVLEGVNSQEYNQPNER